MKSEEGTKMISGTFRTSKKLNTDASLASVKAWCRDNKIPFGRLMNKLMISLADELSHNRFGEQPEMTLVLTLPKRLGESDRPLKGLNVLLELTAVAFVNELSGLEEIVFKRSMSGLANKWDQTEPHLMPLPIMSRDGHPILQFNVGQDLIVLLYRRDQTIVVVDVLRPK